MDCIKKKYYVLVPLLLLSVFNVVGAGVSSVGFTVYLDDTNSLGFQNQIDKWLLLNMEDGELNSSVNLLTLTTGSGLFRFNSSEALNFSLFFEGVSNVRVNGDQGNAPRLVQHEEIIYVNQYDRVTITWSVLIDMWFPVMFAFGMMGLILTVAGPSYGMIQIKKKEYHKGLAWGTIYTTLGVALVLGWLWS